MRSSLFRDLPAAAALVVVSLCWVTFGIILLVGKNRAAKQEIRRDTRSRLGFFMQLVGYAIVFVFNRRDIMPIAPIWRTAEDFVAAATMGIAIVSAWLCFAAALALGKQWALAARVVEGHELVTRGPYAIVRNPIYLAMFGLLIATGLAVSRWQALIAGAAVFLVGNEIRIRSEEKLMQETFGPAFDEYARRVPSFLPRLF